MLWAGPGVWAGSSAEPDPSERTSSLVFRAASDTELVVSVADSTFTLTTFEDEDGERVEDDSYEFSFEDPRPGAGQWDGWTAVTATEESEDPICALFRVRGDEVSRMLDLVLLPSVDCSGSASEGDILTFVRAQTSPSPSPSVAPSPSPSAAPSASAFPTPFPSSVPFTVLGLCGTWKKPEEPIFLVIRGGHTLVLENRTEGAPVLPIAQYSFLYWGAVRDATAGINFPAPYAQLVARAESTGALFCGFLRFLEDQNLILTESTEGPATCPSTFSNARTTQLTRIAVETCVLPTPSPSPVPVPDPPSSVTLTLSSRLAVSGGESFVFELQFQHPGASTGFGRAAKPVDNFLFRSNPPLVLRVIGAATADLLANSIARVSFTATLRRGVNYTFSLAMSNTGGSSAAVPVGGSAARVFLPFDAAIDNASPSATSRVQLRLTNNFSEAGTDGSPERAQFEAQFKTSMESFVGVPGLASRIRVVSVRRGSIFVVFDIGPDPNLQPPSASALATQVDYSLTRQAPGVASSLAMPGSSLVVDASVGLKAPVVCFDGSFAAPTIACPSPSPSASPSTGSAVPPPTGDKEEEEDGPSVSRGGLAGVIIASLMVAAGAIYYMYRLSQQPPKRPDGSKSNEVTHVQNPASRPRSGSLDVDEEAEGEGNEVDEVVEDPGPVPDPEIAPDAAASIEFRVNPMRQPAGDHRPPGIVRTPSARRTVTPRRV